MNQYIPRDYQDAAIAAVFREFQRYWSTLIVIATGGGKTECYIQVADMFLKAHPGKRVMVIAHREELITQPAKRWHRNYEEWPAIEMGEMKVGGDFQPEMFEGLINQQLVIATVQTLNTGKRCRHCTSDCHACSRKGKIYTPCNDCHGEGCDECKGKGKFSKRCKQCKGDGWVAFEETCDQCFEHFVRRMQKFPPDEFGLLVIDEAHHSFANTYGRVIRYFRQRNPGLKVLGLTATADRGDGEELGQIFESTAFEYSLPQPILDGWLTPIQQRFVVVEELNLANVRTMNGDLNEGDLEHEMIAERVLHRVTTPLVEIACGLEEGTIDRLLSAGRINELPDLCVKHEPTLIHAASVAHAERMAEIMNRYLPDSALCIVGTTLKDDRRNGLEKFSKGGYQFLLSCGVFLEGTDLPNVSIVAMARPTRMRNLYAQMLGRGLRVLPGVIDGITDPAERVRRIAESKKPCATIIDFVGNSGRHKLISAVDILGEALPGSLVEGVIRKAVTLGQSVDILKALEEAKQEAEEQERRRKEAAEKRAEEERRRKEEADKRRSIMAGASYSSREVDPFDVHDHAAAREQEADPNAITPGQVKFIRFLGFDLKDPSNFSKAQARRIITMLRKRVPMSEVARQNRIAADNWQARGPTAAQMKWPGIPFERAKTPYDASQLIEAKNNPQDFVDKKLAEIERCRTGADLDGVGADIGLTKCVLAADLFSALVEAGKRKRAGFRTAEIPY